MKNTKKILIASAILLTTLSSVSAYNPNAGMIGSDNNK